MAAGIATLALTGQAKLQLPLRVQSCNEVAVGLNSISIRDGKSGSEKGVFWKRGKVHSRDSREFRDSRVSREPLDCGKERRFQPFSRESRDPEISPVKRPLS